MSLKSYGQSVLAGWGEWSLKHPFIVLMGTLLCAYLAWEYTASTLRVNTDTAELVAPEAPFQQNRRRFEQQFPHDFRTLLLVVKSATPELTQAASQRLERMLKADKTNFEAVYLPENNAFFRKNGLLYLEADALQAVSDTFSQAQPFLGRIYQEPNLAGFFSILQDTLSHAGEGQEVLADWFALVKTLSSVVHDRLKGEQTMLSWQGSIAGENADFGSVGWVLAKPVFDYTKVRPAQAAITAVRSMEKQIQVPNMPPVQILITGEVGLEDDEIAGMGTGTFVASLFSLVVVVGILSLAYRSWSLTLSTGITLVLGLVFCGAFAAVAVRDLNLISVAFAVSNIGLGVEYAIHFCLRYRDGLLKGYGKTTALKETLAATSPSLLLCAATTAIGLYAFIPTDYKGVSELGLLAGTSLFICLGVTLTVLPVLLRILPAPKVSGAVDPTQPGLFDGIPKQLAAFTLHFAKPIAVATLVLALVACALLPWVKTDFNPINLRDPHSESVIAFKELVKDKNATPMTLAVITQDSDRAKALQRQLEQLPSVDRTVSLYDLVPGDQAEKLPIIQEMRMLLGFHGERFPALELNPRPDAGMVKMLDTIDRVLPGKTDAHEKNTLNLLKTGLEGVLLELDNRMEPDRGQFAASLQTSLLGTLPIVMNRIFAGLEADAVTLENLPQELKQRWLSADGWYRIQVFPKNNLNDLKNLENFITEVQAVAPDATDLPVMYWESMREVLAAFRQAIYTALITIAVVLLVIRRSLTDTVLIMVPLLLAGLFTMASTVLTQTPINFANVIALPLLLGFGVDNGIHMVEKLRHSLSEQQNIYQSSTARAMFYGALTTSSSFAGLAFSSHQGVASMGLVITIGIFWVVTCTFVVLPSLGKLVLKNRH